MRPDELFEAVRLHLKDRLEEVDAKLTAVGRLRQGFDDHVLRLDEIASDISGLAQRINAAPSLTDFGERISGLADDVNALGERLDGLSDPADVGAKLLEPVASAVREMGERVDSIVLEMDGTLTSLADACENLTALKDDVSRLDTTTGGMQTAVGAVSERLDAVQEEMTAHDHGIGDVRANLEAVVNTVDSYRKHIDEVGQEFDAALAALEARTASLATDLHIRIEESTLQRSDLVLDKLSTRVDEHRNEVYAQLLDVLEDSLQTLRGDLLQRYTQAEAWARGGEEYKQLAIVRHRGGLWQATVRTSAEPAPECPDWMLLSDGIDEVGYEFEDKVACATVRMSSGIVHRSPIPYPVFRSRGTYRAGEGYKQWDVVVRNRTTFMAAEDTDTEPSNGNKKWIQLSDVVQGPKGPAGRDGRSVNRDDLIALLPQITRMLADEMESREEQAQAKLAAEAAEAARL
jgi:methyl-accepting chemotaxis protein